MLGISTEILKIYEEKLEHEQSLSLIDKAASVIRKGGLVAFPTETVYGLGANALDEKAAAKIYAAKGRPSDNPLIVHISDISWLGKVAVNVPENALKLFEAFSPGPLTVILQKREEVPFAVTCGLNTVGVRIPQNKIARKLIERAGVPIAAPSANTSGKPSPTCAKHVVEDLNGKVEVIIDGGDCAFGIESTIIDMSSEKPHVLRPGSVTNEMLEKVLGTSLQHTYSVKGTAPKAPGMKYTHYSPLAEVVVVKGEYLKIVEKINELCKSSPKKAGVMCTDATKYLYTNCKFVQSLGKSENPETIAHALFKSLRSFDENGIELVFSEAFYYGGVSDAIMDRLLKAAGGKVMEV